nr:DUF805 domain-containing protein [Acinetobacter sp. Marseille-Q1620]
MQPQDNAPFFSKNQQSVTDNPLSPNGRFNRLSFIGWYGFLYIIVLAVTFALSLTIGIFNLNTMQLNTHFMDALSGLAGLGFLIILIFYIYFNFVIVIRRLHDRNKSGWLCLLLFVPIINFFFSLYLIFARGCHRPNRFGHPRPASVLEKIMAWIMIIFTVLSLFASASIYSYLVGSGELENPGEIIQKGSHYV